VPRSYSPEFRRKALDVKAGRSVVDLVRDLQIGYQTIYNWRRQELIDIGQLPEMTSIDQSELVAAPRRIDELGTELAIHRRVNELLREPPSCCVSGYSPHCSQCDPTEAASARREDEDLARS
jgi:transposase-like protein